MIIIKLISVNVGTGMCHLKPINYQGHEFGEKITWILISNMVVCDL